jgi:hypothetical protein
MKQLRLVLGLALILLCTWLGSLIPVGTGSGIVIGFIGGMTLSYLLLTYGPGHTKSSLPTSYFLGPQHQDNGGINQQSLENATLSAREVPRRPPDGRL